MLRLDLNQRARAIDVMAASVRLSDGLGTFETARVMLEALGRDFDIDAMDFGPREDITSGNVWGCARCSSTDHETTDHDEALIERIKAEITAHNQRLGAL